MATESSPSKSKSRPPQSPLVKHYLAFYNLVQFSGWFYGLYLTLKFFITIKQEQRMNFRLLWEQHTSMVIIIFQTYQFMEVIHAALRFVPSNPFQTFTQIFSRLMLVWGILIPIPEARTSLGVPLLLVAWSIAECTRYSYYVLNIYNMVPYICTWLRYTLFIVLYPMGVTGEVLTVLSALEPIRKRKFLSFELPNSLNISFHYDVYCVVFLLSYFYFFPQLYLYMIRSRKKMLGANNSNNLEQNLRKSN